MAAVGKETFTKRVENGAEKCKQFQMAFLQLGCGLMNCLLKTMLVIDFEAWYVYYIVLCNSEDNA